MLLTLTLWNAFLPACTLAPLTRTFLPLLGNYPKSSAGPTLRKASTAQHTKPSRLSSRLLPFRPLTLDSQSYNWAPLDPAKIEGAGESDYQLADGLVGKSFRYNLYGKGDEACDAIALHTPAKQASRRLRSSSSGWTFSTKASDFSAPKGALVAGGSDALDKWGPPKL